jgi:hypothetical protein
MILSYNCQHYADAETFLLIFIFFCLQSCPQPFNHNEEVEMGKSNCRQEQWTNEKGYHPWWGQKFAGVFVDEE